MKSALLSVMVCFLLPVQAELRLPAIFSDHMVLQRGQANPVWGTSEPGASVSVRIDDQVHKTTADEEGGWRVMLDPMTAGGPYDLSVEADEAKTFTDVLVGEVWFCSGQSNMEWPVGKSLNADLDQVTAQYPEIRILSVPKVAAEEPMNDFEGAWQVCSPETVESFSAVGFFFGRRLYHALDVPIGLVDNAWGGSVAEAWMPREVLDRHEPVQPFLREWDEKVAAHDPEAFARAVEQKKTERRAWIQNGRKGPAPRVPRNPIPSRKGPSLIYNGVLAPTIGYGIRGFIWYQGESNDRRAYEYRTLFPLLIETFREQWGQGDFPFYWVQLADFREEPEQPEDPDWAWLRESQTLTLDTVPNVGQAVIIDAGEGRDIHPRDKQTVADRLARIALARDYGFQIPYRSPRFDSLKIQGEKALVIFRDVSGSLRAFDTEEPVGFAVAGEDRVFHWAQARLKGKDQVLVWSDAVPNPIAVRYAWANNPVCNLYDGSGLPVTPFRTDDWPKQKAP